MYSLSVEILVAKREEIFRLGDKIFRDCAIGSSVSHPQQLCLLTPHLVNHHERGMRGTRLFRYDILDGFDFARLASLPGIPFNRTSDVGPGRLRSESSRSGRLGMC